MRGIMRARKCYCGHSSSECGLCKPILIQDFVRGGIKRKVLQCETCGLVYLEHKNMDLHEFYKEEYRKTYSPTVGQESSPQETFNIYRPFMQERIDRVKPHLTSNMCILEIGCSTGHFLDALTPYVKERIGLEYNLAHSEFIRKELGLECYTDPIQQTDIPRNSLDMVFMFHVLEHTENPTEFLHELLPFLTETGKIYIEVPNVDDALIYPYAVSEYAAFYYREPHLFYFSPSTLRKVTYTAGYEGEIEMVQRYSLANHLHWVTARSPMRDAKTGMSAPKLTGEGIGEELEFTADLDAWLEKADGEYRELLKKHGRAESMAYIGRPRARGDGHRATYRPS